VVFKPYFEIIDEKGVVESPFRDMEEALSKLYELDLDYTFKQNGDLKIVQVLFIRA
jgi:hypothetical protein